MELSDDLPPRRRALFFPVVIATVFLTIIGMAGGIALAYWHTSRSADNQGQTYVPPTAAPSADTRPACRQETQVIAPQHGAQGTLRIALLLRTKFSAIWICQDEAGQYFYHANRGGEQAIWIEGETALFMAGVKAEGDDDYTVTATDGTVFDINRQRLQITHKDGKLETQTAVN